MTTRANWSDTSNHWDMAQDFCRSTGMAEARTPNKVRPPLRPPEASRREIS